MTALQAVQVCAVFMQRQFMSGVPYGSIGTPNMQSILGLSAMSDADAHEAVMADPRLAAVARELQAAP